jgi:hypothetical protein
MFDVCTTGDAAHRYITEEVKNIYVPVFMRVWQELEFRIDVCRVTRGAHIEYL